jgi:hypothetical protein
MTSRGTQIADALKSAYQAGHANGLVSQQITVNRVWSVTTKKAVTDQVVWDSTNPQANAIQVYLMLGPETPTDEITRDRFLVDYNIQVGLAARPIAVTPIQIDPLIQVSQELRDLPLTHAGATLIGIQEQILQPAQIVADPDFDSLQTDKLFLSVWTFNIRGARLR